MAEFLRHGIDAVHQKLVHPYLTRGEAQNDREIAHERAIHYMEVAQKIPFAVDMMGFIFNYNDPILKTTIGAYEAPNPFGLAAGFDKNARVHPFIGKGLRAGRLTVGSITKVEYDGNKRPRIFDLPDSRGVINRMGFPGEGSASAVRRLRKDNPDKRSYHLTVNFAASAPSFNRGTHIEDYRNVAEEVVDFGERGEMNVSSPNTVGVRGLQEPEEFNDLWDAVSPVYIESEVDLIAKFGPDLEKEKREKNTRTMIDKGAAGITLGNTSTGADIRSSLSPLDIHREEGGGISGKPHTKKALEVAHETYNYVGEELPIHMVGGLDTGEDIWNALTYGGARTADFYTSFIRQETSTPNFFYYRARELAMAMRANDMTSMEDFKELRGKNVPYPLKAK